MNNSYCIGQKTLSIQDIVEICKNKIKLELSENAVSNIIKSSNYLNEKIKKADKPIYGVTTGFGALHNVSIGNDEVSKLQENLIMSHACGVGERVRPQIVKLMLLLKANALSLGYSAVQLPIVQRIIDFYNNDIIPIVYEQGSLGASGDLSPLAHLFLPLIGFGKVMYQDQEYTGAEILNKFGWQPIKLLAKEGLALLNGTQFMSSHGVYALIKAQNILELADKIAAVSIDAFDGRIEPFDEDLHKIRPHSGQLQTSANIRQYLQGSQIVAQTKKHVQDPYSFRCIPQVHGASKDAIAYANQVITTEINSVTDNPTVFVEADKILSGGNFHGQPLAIVFDFMSIAIAEIGSISERRTYRLISGERGLPPFLVKKPGLNSGFMIPQYTAASIVSQNKQLATPASVDSLSSSNEQEDHVSMGANAATKLIRIVENVEKILAIELLNAAQALEFRRPLKSSPFVENFVEKYRQKVKFVEDDIVMYEYIHKSIEFLREI